MATTTPNRYYEDELVRLRELAAEFARAHPLLAPMLGAPSGDPTSSGCSKASRS